MAFTPDKLKTARDSGYTDDEIWDFLGKDDQRFNLAKENGYSLDETITTFSSVSPAPAAEPEPERRAGGGITGGAADVGVQFMKGLGTGTRMISDVFGANNPVSKAIAGYEDYMDGLLSAESKQDSQEISRILKDAEGKGILPQIMAGLEAFTVAPAEMTATTMGMMLPNLAGGVYAKAAQLTKAGVLGLQMGIGAAQGMGSVKGQIYTAVQEELRQQGLPEDQIDKVATEAQAYNGKNLDQILIGAGLGAAASSTGAEKIMTRLITGAGKEATEDIIKATIKGGLSEAPIEALQGGQEKVAENVALQRIGVDVPTMQGVIPAATMEATAGLLIGGGLGGVEAFVSPEKKEEDDIDKQAQQTANEFLAPNDPTSQAMVKELARRENAVKNLQEAYDVLEPTSPEAQKLKLELSDAQRKLSAYKEIANKAGLSLPIKPPEKKPTIEITQEQIDKATQDFTATPEGARAILENKPFESSQSKTLPEGWFNETYGGTIFSIPPSIVKIRLPAQAELRNLSILERAALTGKLTKEKIVNEIDAQTYIEDAAKQGFTTEQIDAAAPEAEAKWNERFGEGGIARKVAGDVSPPIVDFAAEEAARAGRQRVTGGNALPANKLFGKTAREALQYLADQNLGASELEREGRPLNISQIMQRAASVIAKLPLRILDADFIKSAAGGNRAYRHSQGFIRIPATSRGRTYFERPETLVHEVGHTLTADAIRKYVFTGTKAGQSGDRYLRVMDAALDDANTPEQIKKLISLYKKAIDELGLTNDYFGANGLASTDATSSQKKAFSRKKPLINKFTGKKIGWSELYALANLDEFVAQAWSSPAFQDLLKSIKVKNEPSIFEQFVRIIRDLFGFESDTMAAAVIDASFALAELEAPATRGTVEERIAANIARGKEKKAPKERTPAEPKKMAETAQDAEYLAAVERGDMKTAQRMVDEAAKKAGYDTFATHRTNAKFTVFDANKINKRDSGFIGDGFYFSPGGISQSNEGYGRNAYEVYLSGKFLDLNPRTADIDKIQQAVIDQVNEKRVSKGLEKLKTTDTQYQRIVNDFKMDTAMAESGIGAIASAIKKSSYVSTIAKRMGFDGAFEKNEIVVFDPSQIKSADPVTYDDAGDVIPLSQRFRPTSPDIRMAPLEQPAPEKPITDPATPDEQTQQLVQQAQEQESIVDAAVKEAGDDVFNVFNRLVNEGKTEDQVAKELGISNYDVRKYKLRADTAILNKMKQKKVKPLAFAPKNPVAEFAEKNLRKYFTKEGWLPKAVFQSWVKRNAALSREQKEAEFAIKDLYAGIREVFGISKMEMIAKGLVSVPPEFVQQLNDALAGKIDINTMPEPVREPLTRMRQHIDAMSRQLVDLNVLPDELAAKISANLGVYLTRSYKIFTDKNWINKIPTEKLTAARNFLYQQQLKNDPEATIEMADRELRNMLNDWASDAEGLRKRGGKLGAKDLTVMMERAKVPKVLREVMGENTNVIFNYANTIGKISRFVADQKFLNEVKAKGTGEFLFTEKDAPKGFNTKIAAEESRTMSPLNGLRTTPEIAKAFEEFGKGYDARENPGLYVLAWMNAVGKLNLTVGSVLTQIRNLLGQPAFFVFNGHYNWRVIRQEIDAIAKEKGISQEDAKKELVKLAAAQGLVNENAYAGELRTAFQDVGLETFDDIGPDEFTKQFVLTRMYLKGVKSAQELYQKTDEFGKIVGWLNETKRIQRMNKGMDKQTAQSIAAERTRDTYPTYSQSSEALRLFRRQPFFGPFATFFYETFRTSFHNLRYAFEDINGPTPEHKAEGIKRLAGAMTTLSMGAFGINLLSKLASGIGDDEEEDVRRMLPPWAKDASLAWMPKSKDGTYNFINVSYINPYNAMTDPFIAMMSGFAKGDKPEEIAAQALGSFLSPFSSEQPVTATIADAMRNRTETGKQIYNPQDDITTKTSKIMLHIFGKTFTPGTITRLRERIIPAIQGETVGTRAPAPAKEIAAELTGIRFETLDMNAAFSNKAWEFSKAANESERIFRDVATRRRRVDEQEQIDAYRRSEQTRYEIWNDMYRDYMAVRRAGASPAEAIRLMTDIGISKKEAIAISKGRYVPYQVSDEVLRRSKLNENKVPIKEIRAIGKEMPRVLTDITKTP